MPLRYHDILLLIFLLCALVQRPVQAFAAGQLSGAILYGAAQYRAEVAGDEVTKATSQYEQVFLQYEKQGLISDARIGKYTLMLGYEFNVLDPSISYNKVKDPAVERLEAGKVLYQGNLVLAPGGLPFRLTAYARDIHPTTFLSSGRLNTLPNGQVSLINPEVPTEINNGTHRQIGGTLLVGIHNGSYLGSYRDVLSKLPRLLIDYRQIEVRDLSRDTNMQHYRARDLAFISLNKKDNWIHLRMYDYVDFLNSEANYTSSQVLIGSIDHALTRQWINLTNWIKISGDLSYNTDKPASEEFSANTYNVNLFAIARRQETQATVFTSFARTAKGAGVGQSFTAPVYFSYEPNRNSLYRGSLSSRLTSESYLDGSNYMNNATPRSSRNFTFDLGAELFRTRSIVFKPRIMLEGGGDESSRGFSEKIHLEWSNHSRRSLAWTAGYAMVSSQTSDDNNSSFSLEQRLFGNVEKELSSAWRGGARASVRSSIGQNYSTSLSTSSSSLQLGTSGAILNESDSREFQAFDGRVFLEHAGELFSNRIEFVTDGIKTEVATILAYQVLHMLQKHSRDSKFTLSSSLLVGSGASAGLNELDYLNEDINADGSNIGWSSKADYVYTPSRSLRLSLYGSVNGISGGESNNMSWRCSQKLDYRIFTINGVVRKIAEFSEELGEERTTVNGAGSKITFLRVEGSVYPTKYLYTKLASELLRYNPSGSEQVTLNGEAGMHFEKFQVALSYGRGYKTSEGLLASIKEERWDLKVRKTF